jgi:outer membrane protein insertion porin family
MVTYGLKHKSLRISGVSIKGMVWLMTLFTCLLMPQLGQGQQKKIVAVLPFSINATEPLDRLKTGLQEMITTRLSNLGLSVVAPSLVNKNPQAFVPMLEKPELTALGRALKADYIVTGSLTVIGRKISLDLKALDVRGEKPPVSIFMVEDDLDMLAEAADRVSKSLYNQIAGIVQIDSILVKGNKRVESEAILAVVESKKGEALDYDKLDRDLRAIFAMGYFRDVNIQTEDGPKGKIVIFNVTEKPSIGKITFHGNKKKKTDELSKETGIKLYSIYNPSEIKQSVNRLKDFYKQNGYYNVDIKERIEDLPGNEVALIYDINEGQKFYIKKIQFVGNTKFRDKDLKAVMETSEKGILSWITSSGVLDEKKLELDVHKITTFYQNHGYIQAKVGEPKITYEKGGALIITIPVVEGEPYTVDKVKLEGKLIQPEEEILKKMKTKKGNYFSREVVRQDVLTLRDLYADQGFAYANVSPRTEEDDKNHLINVVYHISPGDKIRIERINIYGNTVTRDKVIRRELAVVEGENFSGTGLRKSTERLNRLGFFENVEIQTKKGSQDDRMVLDINVKERSTGTFSVGAGYSQYEGTMGLASISQRNLFGTGEQLSASATISSVSTEYNVQFLEPWLFDRHLSAAVNLYHWNYTYPDYTTDSSGGALTLRFPLGFDEYTRGLVKYGYDTTLLTDVASTADYTIQELAGEDLTTSSVTMGIERDSRDTLFNTRKGSENSLTFQYAGIGGDVDFNRYEFSSAWYFPLPWQTAFMVKGRWGYIQGRDGGVLPDYQLYRIGGINTVRGYDDWSITAKDPATGQEVGGNKMMIYNLEYRFPLLKEQGVVGVVFFDAGNVFGADDNYSFTDMRTSAGLGVRWYSPMGPIRIEYGFILNPRVGDPTGNVAFSFGGTF